MCVSYSLEEEVVLLEFVVEVDALDDSVDEAVAPVDEEDESVEPDGTVAELPLLLSVL